MCACFCLAAFALFAPMGGYGKTADTAIVAEDMLAKGDMKTEMSIAQSPEQAPEFSMDGAAPMEEEPAAAAPGIGADREYVSGSQENSAVPDVSLSKFNVSYSWTLNAADAQAVRSYLETGTWVEGKPRCMMDCVLTVDSIAYTYSSACGVFYDVERNAGLTLEEADHIALNKILEIYLPNLVEVKIMRGADEFFLDGDDIVCITEYLSSDGWIMSAANCLCDYTICVNEEIYLYHSECGTIQDGYGKSLPLPEEDKQTLNDILESY